MAISEVEMKFQAERAMHQLPPQVMQGDFEIAKAALEKIEGFEIPKHWLPSKAYFERKLSHVETFYGAESLTTVTKSSQSDAIGHLQDTEEGVWCADAEELRGPASSAACYGLVYGHVPDEIPGQPCPGGHLGGDVQPLRQLAVRLALLAPGCPRR